MSVSECCPSSISPRCSANLTWLVESAAKQRMPPPDALRQFTKPEIELFKRWIEQGGQWQGHWASIRPDRPAPAQIADDREFVRNEIDRFVLLRLREKGFSPSPE